MSPEKEQLREAWQEASRACNRANDAYRGALNVLNSAGACAGWQNMPADVRDAITAAVGRCAAQALEAQGTEEAAWKAYRDALQAGAAAARPGAAL